MLLDDELSEAEIAAELAPVALQLALVDADMGHSEAAEAAFKVCTLPGGSCCTVNGIARPCSSYGDVNEQSQIRPSLCLSLSVSLSVLLMQQQGCSSPCLYHSSTRLKHAWPWRALQDARRCHSRSCVLLESF